MTTSMIELCHQNVRTALFEGISIMAWCPTQVVADYVFRRAIDLYLPLDPENGSHQGTQLSLRVHKTTLRFKSWQSRFETYKGFRGIHMIHPDLSMNFKDQRDFDIYDDMMFHNTRYLNQWRS